MEALEAERRETATCRQRPRGRTNGEIGDASSDAFVTRLDGPAPEVDVSKDMVKRGLLAAPVLIAVCLRDLGQPTAPGRRPTAIAIVLANFLLVGGDHRHDGAHLARPDDGRRAVRLPDPPRPDLPRRLAGQGRRWISLPALGATIIVTHLGLLAWELKYVAISLAHPGLKPHAVSSP